MLYMHINAIYDVYYYGNMGDILDYTEHFDYMENGTYIYTWTYIIYTWTLPYMRKTEPLFPHKVRGTSVISPIGGYPRRLYDFNISQIFNIIQHIPYNP